MAVALDLQHSVALITGGGRGIGRAIALSLARAGAMVIIADLSEQQSTLVADEVHAEGHAAVAAQLDVTDKESVRLCVDSAIRKLGHIDILVNNAGVFQRRLGLELQDEDFNRCLDVNLTGIWRLSQQLTPHFKNRGGGKIINIASISGRRGLDWASAYSASKAAVINLTQSLATALGPHGVNVNAICPGGVATAMQEDIKSLVINSEFESRLRDPPPRIPLTGPLTAEDIGHAVVFFASGYARSITGQALNVDGGEVMN